MRFLPSANNTSSTAQIRSLNFLPNLDWANVATITKVKTNIERVLFRIQTDLATHRRVQRARDEDY